VKKITIIFLSVFLIFLGLWLFISSRIAYHNPSSIFFSNNQKVSNIENFTLTTTGDIGLGRYVNHMIITHNDPNFPFLHISQYLRSADLTITNLESPLIKNCPTIITGFRFCGQDTNIDGLLHAGIDTVNLANNHTTNYGIEGLIETQNLLEENGIIGFGVNNEIKYTNIKGYNIALLGFVELGNNWHGLTNATENTIKSLIREARNHADIVIAAFHWGNEYTHNPSENQIRLGRLAVENGADLILGNHAHWIQPYEIYQGKYIIYAQGNTIFDQDWSEKTKQGVLYTFEFANGKFNLIDEKYTIIEHNSQPRFATSEEGRGIEKSLEIKGN